MKTHKKHKNKNINLHKNTELLEGRKCSKQTQIVTGSENTY